MKLKSIETYEAMTREELIAVCEQNDPNGIYSDEDSKSEGLPPATKELLLVILTSWIGEV